MMISYGRSSLTWLRAGIFAVAGAGLALAAIGIPTDVVANPWFTRMTPIRPQDYLFLTLSVALGALLAASYAFSQATSCSVGQGKTVSGGLLSVFAIGCPICNKLVLLLLGTSGALTYFQPIQPVLGVLSVALLGLAVWVRWQPIRRGSLPVGGVAELDG